MEGGGPFNLWSFSGTPIPMLNDRAAAVATNAVVAIPAVPLVGPEFVAVSSLPEVVVVPSVASVASVPIDAHAPVVVAVVAEAGPNVAAAAPNVPLVGPAFVAALDVVVVPIVADPDVDPDVEQQDFLLDHLLFVASV